MANKRLEKKAYAKVNLSLDVLGRRENGYHDVKMIMQNLDIYDELIFEDIAYNSEEADDVGNAKYDVNTDGAVDAGYIIEITANKPGIPTDERNLIYKAAKLLFEEYGVHAHLKVNLTKNIPVEAGMAGGSTDCAATLHAVNEMYNLGLSTERLMEYGVKLGADVPYCVKAKTSLSEGIGEVLTTVNGLPDCYVAVAKPPVGVSTKLVYTELDSKKDVWHPDVEDQLEGLEAGDLRKIAQCMGNILETVTVPMHPVIDEIKQVMIKNGALNAIMSGSGPTVFGIFEDKENAEKSIMLIRNLNLAKETFVTRPI